MRFKAKIDANQQEIVKWLRELGYSVHSTAQLGHGFPDIIVGIQNKNYLYEIKDGNKFKSQQKLTKDEIDFHSKWKGHIKTVSNLKEILEDLRG